MWDYRRQITLLYRAMIAQSVLRRAMEFDSRRKQDFSVLLNAQIGSGAYPASYVMGTGGTWPGGKSEGA
jgi:hypothetical protein